MKYPEDINKSTWDKMEDFTWQFLVMLFFIAVICIVFMMIKDVV